MSKSSILNELEIECPFPEVLEVMEKKNGIPIYRRKIGYIRADYDGYRWWNTVFPCHNELSTPDTAREIDAVYERLTAKDAFSTLSEMSRFCHNHPQAVVSKDDSTEYNFFYQGESCLFWIRCITRTKDYNIYLHAFTKED